MGCFKGCRCFVKFACILRSLQHLGKPRMWIQSFFFYQILSEDICFVWYPKPVKTPNQLELHCIQFIINKLLFAVLYQSRGWQRKPWEKAGDKVIWKSRFYWIILVPCVSVLSWSSSDHHNFNKCWINAMENYRFTASSADVKKDFSLSLTKTNIP